MTQAIGTPILQSSNQEGAEMQQTWEEFLAEQDRLHNQERRFA